MMDDDYIDGPEGSQFLLEDDGNEDDDVGPMMLQSTASSSNLMTSPNPKRRSVSAAHRRRRRSSARFLHHLGSKNAVMNDDHDNDVEGLIDDDTDDILNSTQNINSVYKQAIRMNAENKINASNSWNLSLIDHLDRVTMSSKGGSGPSSAGRTMDDSLIVDGVNFTKASCTLDASVKIYSYRVDDVHLTSYKVLANLNRTDHGGGASGSKQTNGRNNSSSNNDKDIDGDDADHDSSRAGNGRSKNGPSGGTTCTLERNLGM
jgi:condensin complex subunit 2